MMVLIRDGQGREGKVVGNEKPYYVDPFGHGYYESPAAYLSRLVTSELGLRARYDKPGTIQRMSMELASKHRSGRSVHGGAAGRRVSGGWARTTRWWCWCESPGPVYSCSTGSVPLARIANVAKQLPPEYYSAEESFVTPAFVEYARPLIGGPLLTTLAWRSTA